jgi:hypothetical protein
LQYWLTDGAQWPLTQRIAIKPFSMTTSSAASERNFSTMSFIHSKLRNSLSEPSVEKLVFIKTNMSIFYDMEVSDNDQDLEVRDQADDE